MLQQCHTLQTEISRRIFQSWKSGKNFTVCLLTRVHMTLVFFLDYLRYHFFLQYIDQGKHKEAIVAFKMAVNIKNNHVGAWMNHALLLEKSGKRLMREL